MIKDATLIEIRDAIYHCVETLYLEDKDDALAQDIAGYLYGLHESIELELLERVLSR